MKMSSITLIVSVVANKKTILMMLSFLVIRSLWSTLEFGIAKHWTIRTFDATIKYSGNEHITISTLLDHPHAGANLITTVAEIKYRTGGPSNVSTSDHPHAGARDADGYWNYVADETFIRRRVLDQLPVNDNDGDNSRYFPLEPELFHHVCQVAPGRGVEGSKGYKILRHVKLNGPDPIPETVSMKQKNVNDATDTTTIMTTNIWKVSPPRILCVIYTIEARHDHLRAIVETWGWRCDGFFAASTQTVSDIAAVDLPHAGDEAYANMWQKTRSILAYLYDNYIDEYDYFHVAGDDTYLIVENLRNYLRLLETVEGGRDTRPLYIGLLGYFGRAFNWEPPYNLGGPGYILNRLALRRLVSEALPTCHADERTFAEDMNVGRCLSELNILPIDTADVAHRQRFFNINPAELAVFNPLPFSKWKDVYKYWAKDHGWRIGLDLVSTQTAAFHHLKTPLSMKRHHAIIYNSCPLGSILRDAATEQGAHTSLRAKHL